MQISDTTRFDLKEDDSTVLYCIAFWVVYFRFRALLNIVVRYEICENNFVLRKVVVTSCEVLSTTSRANCYRKRLKKIVHFKIKYRGLL